MLVKTAVDEDQLRAAILKVLRERDDWTVPQLLAALVSGVTCCLEGGERGGPYVGEPDPIWEAHKNA